MEKLLHCGELGPRGCLSSKPQIPSGHCLHPNTHPRQFSHTSLEVQTWVLPQEPRSEVEQVARSRWQLSGKTAKPQSLSRPPARVRPSAFPFGPGEAWVSATFSPTFRDLRGQRETGALSCICLSYAPAPKFHQPQSPCKPGSFGSQAVALGQRKVELSSHPEAFPSRRC